MSHQTSREVCNKSKKQQRQEAIIKTKMQVDESKKDPSIEQLIPDPDYSTSRNMFDCVPGALM